MDGREQVVERALALAAESIETARETLADAASDDAVTLMEAARQISDKEPHGTEEASQRHIAFALVTLVHEDILRDTR